MKPLITSRTEGQEKQFKRFIEDAAKNGVELALEKVNPDKDGIQRLLENGDELNSAIAEVIVAKTQELSVSNRYANEEVRSNFGYLSGYRKPVKISDQIDILRLHWPKLNPDVALRYYSEMYSTLQLPGWVEGPFAIIRPGFFSDNYGEELTEVLKALVKDRNGKFVNYLENQLGSEYLRQSERTFSKICQLCEQQPGSDILISSAQFGIRHRGKSVRRAREVFMVSEYGKGAKDVGTMILTNPTRLQHYDDLWIDCAGDEYRFGASGRFDCAPAFYFHGGCVMLSAYGVGIVDALFGSVSAFWQ